MYCNDRKAKRLKKKMQKIFGRDESENTVHSVISKKVFDQHKKDFMNYKRVNCIWTNSSLALIQYK